ncbi:MAG: hypothetical protein AAF554_06435 [Bacteroidota bacterium]
MMNFRKTVWATMIAVPTLFTACSEPEVSDEVTQLRQTQADLLAQRVEAQRLENALQEIENAKEQIILDVQTAEGAAAIAAAQANLERENLNLQRAIDSLADYLLTQGLDEAAQHLADYGDAQDDANNVFDDVIDKEAKIAIMQLAIGVENPDGLPGDSISFALAAEIIQRDLDELNADLAAEEAALAILEAVSADPSSAQEEVDEAEGTIQDLTNQNLALDVEIAKATQNKTATGQAFINAGNTIDDYEDALDGVSDAEAEIISKLAEITAKQDEITALGVNLVNANTALATGQAALDNATTALAPYLAAIGVAESNVAAAQNAEYAAQIDYNIVLNEFNNGNATQDELDAAQADLNAAIAATDDAQAALNDAENAADGPEDTYEAALFVRDSALELIDGINDDIADANDDLVDLQAELLQLEETLGDREAEVTNLQADYDDAVANLVALEDADEAAQVVLDDLNAQKTANSTMISNLETVINALDEQIDGINEDIEELKDDIEDTKASVEAKQKMLADNTISETEWQREIAREQAELAKFNEEYNAHLALAQAYLDAYNAAIAALG